MAMRVDRKALAGDEVQQLKVGELQPIRFTFLADEMVYPLKISSINAGYTGILLYCLADFPMVVRYGSTPDGFSVEANLPDFRCHPNASADVLRRMVRDKSSGVRYAVALHPRTPTDLLDVLAKDPLPSIRNGVAHHPRIPVDLLRTLAGDEEAEVRLAVTVQDKAPTDVLERLASNRNSEVASSAQRAIKKRVGAGRNPKDGDVNNGATSAKESL